MGKLFTALNLKSRKLTEVEFNKLAEFLVEDDAGATEGFSKKDAIVELNESDILVYDVPNGVYVVQITVMENHEEKCFEKYVEEYRIDENGVEIISNDDII